MTHEQGDPRRFTCARVWIVSLYLGLTVLAYWPSVTGAWVYDDHRFIVSNDTLRLGNALRFFHDPTVVDPEGNWEGIYRPLRSLSFAIDRYFFDRNPVGYRIHALLAHVLAAFALGTLLSLLLRRLGLAARRADGGPGRPPGPDVARILGHAAGLLYAIHPVNVESVAWVTSRSDVEAGLLGFLTLLALLRTRANAADPGARDLALGIALGVVAFFAKESSVVLPAIGFAVAWVIRPPSGRVAWRRWLALFALAVGFYLLRSTVLGAHAVQRDEVTEGWPLRYPTMAMGFLWYAWRFVAPDGFRFDYQLPGTDWTSSPEAFWFFCSPVAVVALAVVIVAAVVTVVTAGAVLGVRPRTSEMARGILAGIAWGAIALLPVSNLLVSINILVAERFLYVAAGGAMLAVVAIAMRVSGTRSGRVVIAAVLLGWGVFLGATTRQFAATWRTETSLWEAVRAHSPAHYRPYQGLAKARVQSGDYAGARRLLREAITRCGGRHPEIYFDLGRTYLLEQDATRAVPELRRAVDLWRARGVGAKDLRYRRTLMFLAESYARAGDSRACESMAKWLSEAGGPVVEPPAR